MEGMKWLHQCGVLAAWKVLVGKEYSKPVGQCEGGVKEHAWETTRNPQNCAALPAMFMRVHQQWSLTVGLPALCHIHELRGNLAHGYLLPTLEMKGLGLAD